MYRVQTFNSISDKGLTRFTAERYTVSPDTENADAILLRSHKLAPTALTPNLRAVARAGAGVNNVPVAECTERGVVVFNTPGANANAVKELVLCGLLLASRGIVLGSVSLTHRRRSVITPNCPNSWSRKRNASKETK